MFEIIREISGFFFILGLIISITHWIIYGHRNLNNNNLSDTEDIILSLALSFIFLGISLFIFIITIEFTDIVKMTDDAIKSSNVWMYEGSQKSEEIRYLTSNAKINQRLYRFTGFVVSFILFVFSIKFFYTTIETNNTTSRQFKLFLKWLGKKTIPSIVTTMIVAWLCHILGFEIPSMTITSLTFGGVTFVLNASLSKNA